MSPTQVTRDQVLDALRGVQDPDLHKDIVTLGFVKEPAIEGGSVRVTINLTTPACPVKDLMKTQATELLRAIPGVREVQVDMTAEVRAQSGPPRELAKGVKHIVAISSGKGGVGKSTVAVNLAVALAKTGARVGLLDCDVYGPDIPIMMGLTGAPSQVDRKLIPKERHGVKTMSIGYLLDEDRPVIWRGPMVHKLIEQFLGDVVWGELDYLLVDMPPGTGDAQLSLAQIVPLSGAVLVTTPQAVSTFDVGKAIAMFRQVNVDILGIVENMADFVVRGRIEGAGAGTKVQLDTGSGIQITATNEDGRFESAVHVFGQGGAELLAKKHGFPVLGRVPLDPAVRVGGDAGDPVTIAAPASPLAQAFRDIAGRFAQRVAIKAHQALPILQ
ncbi:MAG TPA: Mrp/NBP35 family ATP-binding protein [Planctomycetota bacterium]|nr:Mrp/NBP35 family ATP-binding protein [Planctomycetota bacterium]